MILARTKLPARRARKQAGLGGEFGEMAHAEAEEDNFVYIVPELCYLVGLTEQMKSRVKTVYRDYKQVVRVDAPKKIDEIRVLLDKLFDNEDSMKMLEDWGVEQSRTPAKYKGHKLDAGNVIMGPKPEI